MAERTTRGKLTAEAIASGLKEQYAVLRNRGKIVIELSIALDGRRFLVSESVINGYESTTKTQVFYHLNDARREFRRLCMKNP